MSLTPLPDALAALFSELPRALPATQSLALDQCLGRVLAQGLTAAIDVPAFDNSAMDGYAVRSADLPGTLMVSQRIPAGAQAQPLQPMSVARIFTGAPVPLLADTVVMQENAELIGDAVRFDAAPAAGSNIRRRGADIALGDEVLSPGRVLQPQDLGLAASVGVPRLEVYRPLKVAVIATGNELIEPGQPLATGQIYNSNAAQLAAQLRLLGLETLTFGTLPDDPVVIGDTLESAAAAADCIVTTGGVSVGEEDHVRDQIALRGSLKLWKLAIKPGKPLAFGEVAGCPVFGLPGNPVSAWATFGLVVKPWLMRAQGAIVPPMRRISAVMEFEWPRAGSREEYLRVVLSDDVPPKVRLTGDQSSGVLSGVSRANGLAIIPIGATYKVGDSISVIPVGDFLSPACAL